MGEASEMRQLQAVLEHCAGYYQQITGSPPGPAEAQHTFSALPEGRGHADKRVLGVYAREGADEALVGCADLIRGYPVPGTATVGLFLIVESRQRQGIGTQAFRLVEDSARDWGCCDRIRIGVVRANERVMPFWIRHGFCPTGQTRPWREGSVRSEVVFLEKRVPAPATNR
jgi:RimJ/RimL family protein N-acetyltransferase